MKKYLFLILMVAAVLTGCKEKNNPNDPSKTDPDPAKETTLQSLSVDPEELTLIPYDTVRLSFKWSPATLAEPDVEWFTSDTNVVQLVDLNGAITAVGAGEAVITVKSGDIEGHAKINVVYYEDIFELTGVMYSFPSTKQLLSDSIYMMYGSQGGEYKCKLYSVELFVPSADFAVTADGVANGEGNALFATTNVLYIEECETAEYIGQPWDFIIKITDDEDKLATEPWASKVGSFDVEVGGPIMQAYLEGGDFDGEAFEAAYDGAVICSASISNEGVGYAYIKEGIIQSGYITADYDSETKAWFPIYDFTMYWFYGWYGLAINYEADSYDNLLLQPFELALSDEYHYFTEVTLENAPRMRKPENIRKRPVINKFIADKPVEFKPVKFIAK